jgi:hypothetical protein
MSEIAMGYFAALSTTSASPHTEKLHLNQRPLFPLGKKGRQTIHHRRLPVYGEGQRIPGNHKAFRFLVGWHFVGL